MMKKYFEAIYPAYDGRKSTPHSETAARVAGKIINGNDDLIWHAEHQGIDVPTPNKSARVESRERVSPNGEWVTIRGSRQFFAEVEEFIEKLARAGFSI